METLNYRKPLRSKRRCAEWLNDLRNLSGAYIIRDERTHEILYVGESHTGNLAKTVKRHFYYWKNDDIRKHFQCNPNDIEIAIRLTPQKSAKGAQNNLIKRLNPKYNIQGVPDEPDAF